MKKLIFILTLALCAALPLSTLSAAEKGRCARCGMRIAMNPAWAAKMVKAELEQEFCSPKCLLLTWPADKEGAGKLTLHDYYSTKMIDATTAWYVQGSDVMGPMGPDMVPFATRADAEAFMKEHHGKRLFQYPQLTLARLQALLPAGKGKMKMKKQGASS